MKSENSLMPTLFISHASEDKDAFVRPLAEALSKKFDVWYDEYELRMGDSLRAKIDEGLRKVDYGVVVLSPAFFKKKWTQAELDGLLALETSTRKLILPVWYQITLAEVTAQSPTLAGRLAADAAKGISAVVDLIEQAISASGRTREVAVVSPGREALLAVANSIADNEYERKRLNSVEGVQDVDAASSQIVAKLESDVMSVNQAAGIQRFSIVAGRTGQTKSILGPYGIGLNLDYQNNVINSARDADFSATIYFLTEDMQLNNKPAVTLEKLTFQPRLFQDRGVHWTEKGKKEVISGDQAASIILQKFSHHIESKKPKVR
jgi:hypothetical protein